MMRASSACMMSLVCLWCLFVGSACQHTQAVDDPPILALTQPSRVDATYMPGPVNLKGLTGPLDHLPARVRKDVSPALEFIEARLDDGPLRTRDLKAGLYTDMTGWREYGRQWFSKDDRDAYHVHVLYDPTKAGTEANEYLRFYHPDDSVWRYQAYRLSGGLFTLHWDRDTTQDVETQQETLIARVGMVQGETIEDALKIQVYALKKASSPGSDHHGIYVVDRSKIKHQGTLDHELTYHGRYRVKTEAGLFDTILIESRFTGNVGPAKVKNLYYSFFNPTYGVILELTREEVSAFLIYNQKSHHFIHLKSLEGPAGELKPWPFERD